MKFAKPRTWSLVGLEPTSLLTSGLRYADVTWIGFPPRIDRISSSNKARVLRFPRTSSGGVLSMPCLAAVSEWMSSSRVKWSLSFIFLGFHIHDLFKGASTKVKRHNQHTPLTQQFHISFIHFNTCSGKTGKQEIS